jgi:ribosomal protein S8
MANQFYDLDDLTIDLIDSINPFQHAYEVMSKNITPRLLKAINNIIQSQKIEMTDGEAIRLWNEERPKFMKEHGRLPDINSINDNEKRFAEAIEYLKKRKREIMNKKIISKFKLMINYEEDLLKIFKEDNDEILK